MSTALKKSRKKEILDAAVSCFASTGYYETTMDDIVGASGLSKGALYWYFKSKRDLFRALVEQWFQELAGAMRDVVESDSSAEGRLRSIAGAVAQNAAARPELMRAMLEFYTMAVRDDELRSWLRAIYLENFELLVELFADGVRRGEFANVPPGNLSPACSRRIWTEPFCSPSCTTHPTVPTPSPKESTSCSNW